MVGKDKLFENRATVTTHKIICKTAHYEKGVGQWQKELLHHGLKMQKKMRAG